MKRLILHSLILIAALEVRGQELQFSQPEQLGTVINSDDEELAPMLSPDGLTLYFSRAFHSRNIGGKYAGTDIWISRKDANGNWTPAVNAGKPWNNKRSNAVIGISADGSTVYLSNAYNNRSGISFSKLVAGKWTKPEFIPVPGINRDDFVSVYVHPSFEVMLISMKGKGSYGEEDLYVSVKDSLGSWNQPRNLGPSINTSGFEISPFLSADKKRLYFSSNGHRGLGDADIFYSDRLYDSWETWTAPKNLGEKINTKGFEGYFTAYYDSVIFCVQGEEIIRVLGSKDKEDIVFDQQQIRYLSENEIKNILGSLVVSLIEFEKNVTEISSTSIKDLMILASLIKEKPDLKIRLVAKRFADVQDIDLYKVRLINILNLLRDQGVSGTRISFGSEIETDSSSPKRTDSVLLKLYY